MTPKYGNTSRIGLMANALLAAHERTQATTDHVNVNPLLRSSFMHECPFPRCGLKAP